MIRFTLNLLTHLLAAAPLLAALMLVSKVNYNRDQRVKQSIVPIFALLYILFALFSLYKFNSNIRDFLNWASKKLLIDYSNLIISNLYLLENIILILLFALVKIGLRPLTDLLFDKQRNFGQNLVAQVYEHDPSYDLWFISLRFGNLRTFFRVFYWGSITITVLFTALSRMYPDWLAFSSVAFPAVAALVIGEIYFALDGRTRDEFDRNIHGEEDRARRVANFGPLSGVLREVFPGRVLSDGIALSSRDPLDSSFRIGELSRSENSSERLAAAYFDRLKRSRHEIDVNLLEATVELLKGRSVLFNNPFYSDLTPYIAVPAYINLLSYQKVLVISGRDSAAHDLVKWIREGLESITGVPDLWTVGITGVAQDLDVGILRFGDVHNLDLLKNNEQFFNQVGLIVIIEPARMMSTGQLGLSLLFSRCARQRIPAYAVIDGNHDGLVDALSHLVKVGLTEVVASSLPRGTNSEIVWKADGSQTHAGIFPSVSRYLGLGTDIGAVALKYQVRQVHWVGSETFPVVDMMWIAGQYYGAINSFANLELSQDALSSALVPIPNPWQLKQSENYFLIVEDEVANLYETVRRYSTRATNVGFVNVLSGDYLLRDYMIDNRELFTNDPKAIPAIVPDFARTERNVTLRLLLALLTFEVSEEELIHEFEIAGIPVNIEDDHVNPEGEPVLVRNLRRALLAHTEVGQVRIQWKIGIDDIAASPVVRYWIEPDSQIKNAISHLRPAYFLVEDEEDEVSTIGSLLYGHVYQSLLPGQFVTYGGRYYEVQSIIESLERSAVLLRRASDHIRDRRIYRQLREYRLEGLRHSESMASHVTVGKTEIIRAIATVSAKSTGYLELLSRSDLRGGKRIQVSDLPVRSYVNKSVLVVRFPEIDPKVRKTISVLLNELFVTIFPHSHEYISAVTIDQENQFGDLLPGFEIVDSVLFVNNQDELIVIIEDSMIDLGLIVAVERQWARLMEMITDYLKWDATAVPEESERIEYVPEFPDRPETVVLEKWWQRILRRIGIRRSKSVVKSPANGEPVVEVSVAEEPPEEPAREPAEELVNYVEAPPLETDSNWQNEGKDGESVVESK